MVIAITYYNIINDYKNYMNIYIRTIKINNITLGFLNIIYGVNSLKGNKVSSNTKK